MMSQFTVKSIGKMHVYGETMEVQVEPQYIPALKALDGFSHITIVWWFDGCDSEEFRTVLEVPSPYRQSPDVMGTFTTRSPMRPNPIALTVAQILYIDDAAGIIQIAYTDANDGSQVLDLKPYIPSLDRVKAPEVLQWCVHWPQSIEESGTFDWESVFNF